MARHHLGIRTIISPEIGRPTDKALTGDDRRWMSQRLHVICCGQRWQVETGVSMIKRRLGSVVNARSDGSQCRARMLKATAHNVLIIDAPGQPSLPAA